MSFQDMEFTPEMRKMVVNVRLFSDHLKTIPDDLENPATQLTASALDISESTVKVIMAEYDKKGKSGLDWSQFHQRGHPLSFRPLKHLKIRIFRLAASQILGIAQFVKEKSSRGNGASEALIGEKQMENAVLLSGKIFLAK